MRAKWVARWHVSHLRYSACVKLDRDKSLLFATALATRRRSEEGAKKEQTDLLMKLDRIRRTGGNAFANFISSLCARADTKRVRERRHLALLFSFLSFCLFQEALRREETTSKRERERGTLPSNSGAFARPSAIWLSSHLLLLLLCCRPAPTKELFNERALTTDVVFDDFGWKWNSHSSKGMSFILFFVGRLDRSWVHSLILYSIKSLKADESSTTDRD